MRGEHRCRLHEHGGVTHVLVSGASGVADARRVRLVTFDLENAFKPQRDLQPLIAKEIASCVRSLARAGGGGRGHAAGDAGGVAGGVAGGGAAALLQEDLQAFVRGYGARDRLAAATAHYLRNPSLLWRALWSVDRWREERRRRPHGKYALLAALQSVLDAHPVTHS